MVNQPARYAVYIKPPSHFLPFSFLSTPPCEGIFLYIEDQRLKGEKRNGAKEGQGDRYVVPHEVLITRIHVILAN